MAFARFFQFTRKPLVTCLALLCLTWFTTSASAQSKAKPTIPDSWMDHFSWRSIGPANMSGRISSLAVYEKDSRIWYVASASGGLLKTVNNGVDFEHQFDEQATVSIGDVQVSQKDPNIVWVGTGEANPRNSVSWGDGVYKSIDGGKTWKNMGLKESFQIGRIAIHPKNPDVVYVGALGRLWGPSEERGLFKTTDGGKTWEKILFVDNNTGVIDVKMHPKDPDTLLVATYERKRDGFDGNDPEVKYGEGAGLYRTTNGGKTFKKVTKGLPSCKLGRIGLDWYRKDTKYVYAIVESENIAKMPKNRGYAGIRGEDADVGARLTNITDDAPAAKAGLKVDDIILQINGEMVLSYQDLLKQMRMKKAGDELKLLIIRDRKQQDLTMKLAKPEPSSSTRSDFTGTLGGQAANMQGQQGGKKEEEYGGVYMSEDGGVSWKRINTLNPRPMYYSQIRVDPSDRKNMYVLGTSLYRSIDGGETFKGDGGNGVHSDNHALWIDPEMSTHMVLGCDGGVYVTWDQMDNWDHLNHVAIGQFYHVGIDHKKDYKVYGGLQDNGSWGGPAQSRSGGMVNSDWFNVGGGDGFITLVDPNDADQIYYESQNGSMGRTHLKTGERGFIRPRAPRGARGSGGGRVRYRFNWKTPFILSPHNSAMHYSAGNYVFRSFWKGDETKAISPEITNTDRGAGSAISESPVAAGVLYVGTTDGAVWMTRDGGENWIEIFVKREEKTEEGKDEESEDKDDESEDSDDEKAESDDEKAESDDKDPEESTRGRRGRRSAEGSGETSGESGADRPRERRRGAKKSDAKKSGAKKSDAKKSDAKKSKAKKSDAKKSKAKKSDAKKSKAKKSDAKKPKAKPTADKKSKGKSDKKQPAEMDDETAAMMGRLVGSWKGELLMDRIPEGQREIEIDFKNEDGELAGTFTTPRNETNLSDFDVNVKNGKMTFKGKNEQREFDFDCQIKQVDGEDVISGEVDMGRFKIEFEAKKVGKQTSISSLTNALLVSTVSTTIQEEASKTDEDLITGVWAAELDMDTEQGPGKFKMELRLKGKGKVTGFLTSPMGDLEVADGKFNSKNNKLTMNASNEDGSLDAEITGTISGSKMSGVISANAGQFEVDFSAERESSELPEEQAQEEEKQAPAKEKKAEAAKKTPAKKKPAKQEEASPSDSPKPKTDAISGRWNGKMIGGTGRGPSEMALELKLGKEGKVTGVLETSRSDMDIESGKYNAETGKLDFEAGDSFVLGFSMKVKGDKMTGELDFAGRRTMEFEATRVGGASEAATETEPATADGKKIKGKLEELVPGPRWVSSLEASKHAGGRVFMTLDGHRSNDDEPYVFMSDNYGKTWTSIRSNLPTAAGSTRVIREDIENPDLLFLGCEFSAWVSIDRGNSWTRFKGLPTVAVHEFAIHPTRGEVVVATHGRSLWIADIVGLRELSTKVVASDAALLKPNNVISWRRQNQRGASGTRRFVGENPDQTAEIYYYLGSRAREVQLEIFDASGNLVRSLEAKTEVGLNKVDWDLRRQARNANNNAQPQQRQRRGGFGGGRQVPKGQYLVVLTVGDREFKQLISVESDPDLPQSETSDEEFELLKLMNLEAGEEGEGSRLESDR